MVYHSTGCYKTLLCPISALKNKFNPRNTTGMPAVKFIFCLYKALSGERNPGFNTILKVIGALGLKLHAEAIQMPA